VNFDFSVALDLDAVSGTRLKEKYVDFKISSFDLPLTAIPDKYVPIYSLRDFNPLNLLMTSIPAHTIRTSTSVKL
jgi:hypothetical protein